MQEEGLPTAVALRSSGLALMLSVSAYVLDPRWMRWSSLELPTGLRWSGAGLGAASLPLSLWVFRAIDKNITPTVETREKHELVTSGPYRWVRHPPYTVGTSFFVSLSLVAANWFMALAGLSVLVVLLARLPKGEGKVIERFGNEPRVHKAHRTPFAQDNLKSARPVDDHDIHGGGDLLELDRHDTETLRERFLPERPGPLVGMHVLQTGHGCCLADRWPNPHTILVEAARNYALLGDPAALTPESLRPHVEGFVEAQESFAPLLDAAFGQVTIWERVTFSLRAAPRYAMPRGFVVRRLHPEDAPYLEGLGPETNWVYKTWYGPVAAASSGYFWGAFAGGRLVCAAGTFFMGQRREEIGVATEPGFRGLGLGPACSGRLCEEIRGRGRVPSWTTSPDNAASVRAAQKLGFTFARDDRLFVVGIDAPEPPRRPAAQPKLRPGTEHPDGRA